MKKLRKEEVIAYWRNVESEGQKYWKREEMVHLRRR